LPARIPAIVPRNWQGDGGGEVLRTVGESPCVIYSAPLHSLPPPGIPYQPGEQDRDVVYLPAPQLSGPHMTAR
jgi:hypothetical protein